MKLEIKNFFNSWLLSLPLPVVIVDYDFRVLLSNDQATTLCDFNFKQPQYLENYFNKSLITHFLEFKNILRNSEYGEIDIKLDHLGHTKMIGRYFVDDMGYYIILMIPLVYKDNFLTLQERYSTIMHYINDSVLITDKKQRIIETNPAFTRITGYEFLEARGRFPTILSSGRQNEAFYTKVYEEMSTKGFYSGELIDRKKNGEAFHASASIIPIYHEESEPYEYIGILKDITELKSLRNKVSNDKHKDSLTGVLNRESFLNVLAIKCELTNENNTLAILFIDLNKFKQVNDTFGHQYGDFVLTKAASRMKKVLRSNDLIGRYGGDEFLILLERVNEESAHKIATNLNEALSRPYVVDEQVIDFVSGSIGIAFAPTDSRNVTQLIQKADSAMYFAKKDVKKSNILMANTLNNQPKNNKNIKTELMCAIENDEFYIRIQPIVNMSDASIAGGEVLARWLNLYFDEVMPGTFIPLIQTLDISKKFDRKILSKTIETLKTQKLRENFFINVNFSAEQFGDSNFVTMLEDLSKENPWLLKHLVIEITESTMMSDKSSISR